MNTTGWAVVDAQTGEQVGDLATGLLIHQGGGEAYEEPDGIWRARDDSYDPPGTVYTRVRVEHRPECPGDRAVNMSHLVEYGAELYGSRRQCYDCATYDGVPTGDELSKMGAALARLESE